jgi:hypothetical protein
MSTSARRESASGGSSTFVLAVDVTRQPDGAVNVTPLAVVSGVSAESSSMLGFAGWQTAAPAKLKDRTSAKIPTPRMQFLQKKWDPDVRQDHHPEERRFGARAGSASKFSARRVSDLPF